MLFNSTFFLFLFLPIAFGVYRAVAGDGARKGLALGWLLAASLFFYAWSQPGALLLLCGSIVANYVLGLAIARAQGAARRGWLWGGIALDLGLLGWFKYTGFFVESLAALGWVAGDTGVHFHSIALPLAISFFTFQQIAFLVETYQGEVRETRFLHYALFVAFFPKLVAGPIVHHGEIMEQLDEAPGRRFDPADLAVGLTLFSFGLFKKVVLADTIALRANPLFGAAALGVELSFLESWVAAFAYTFQVYFDFSGYTDMALGVARCFGIVLPLNFYSPYKATNISDFWRRWHVSLTRWLRLYLFLPISRRLMRRGEAWEGPAVFVAQLVTMLLCGLWHGAGWSFVVWGGLHGLLLLLHDGWVSVKSRSSLGTLVPAALGAWLGRATLLVVLAATFVVFRAADLHVAGEILQAMTLQHGLALGPEAGALAASLSGWFPGGVAISEITGQHAGLAAFAHLLALLAIVWLLPNSLELLDGHRPALDVHHFTAPAAAQRKPARLRWAPTVGWALIALGAFLVSLYRLLVEGYQEFVYRFF